MLFYGFDSYYFLLVVPAMLLALWAQIRVRSSFEKYSKVMTRSGVSGADAARSVLEANGVRGVRIERTAGSLSDHFDPRTNTIYLSDTVINSRSVAAVGVAAHEAGHAVQYAEEYFPLKIRSALVPVTQIGSQLSWPLILIGLIVEAAWCEPIFYAGLLLFSTSLIFQLVTLPVEFNASRRAISALGGYKGALYDDELPGAKRVLGAAAMTYVAATITALAQVLRILLIFAGRRGNRR